MSWNFKNTETELSKARLLPNMHVHSKWCIHATNELKDLEDEFKLGSFIALNEHFPYPESFFKEGPFSAKISTDSMKAFFSRSAMPKSELNNFIEEVSKLTLPVGFEVDILDGFFEEINSLIDTSKKKLKEKGKFLNHVSLSVHLLEGYNLFDGEGILFLIDKFESVKLVELYFDTFMKGIKKIHCDFICHPGLLEFSFKRGDVPFSSEVKDKFNTKYKELIELCLEKDICIELNMSGFDKGLTSPCMPSEIFQYCKSKGVKFTTSSDWHHPKLIHSKLDQLYDFLKKEGIDVVYKILDCKKIPVNI